MTDESIYNERRSVLKKLGFFGAGTLMNAALPWPAKAGFFSDDHVAFNTTALDYSADVLNQHLVKTPEKKVISHNNYDEFAAQKNQPVELAQGFKVKPWQLKISGECDHPIQRQKLSPLKLYMILSKCPDRRIGV